jgi:hypothetical protein
LVWTNPQGEDWFGFNVGVPVAAVPEPSIVVLMVAGLLFVSRRIGTLARRNDG